jgi:hypothetical protein
MLRCFPSEPVNIHIKGDSVQLSALGFPETENRKLIAEKLIDPSG